MTNIEKYNLQNRRDIPKEYPCCWNCKYMAWMVGIGQGVRCSNEKNQYRVFGTESHDINSLKMPVIPGVARKCEHFHNKHV
jgi:hypothetical protein